MTGGLEEAARREPRVIMGWLRWELVELLRPAECGECGDYCATGEKAWYARGSGPLVCTVACARTWASQPCSCCGRPESMHRPGEVCETWERIEQPETFDVVTLSDIPRLERW